MRRTIIASCVVAAAACSGSGIDAPADQNGLRIAVMDDTTIEGTFAYGGSFLQFRSESVDQAIGTLWLDVNGIQVDVTLDIPGMTFEQDGHLNALYEEDTAILEAFSIALPEAYPGVETDTLQGKLLVRHTNRLADAPNGLTLAHRVIDISTINPTITDRGASCGNDGVTCLAGTSGYAYAYHDKPGYSCQKYWRKYGKYTSNCSGRCGKGCSSWDKNYTQDCFDHDICVGINSAGNYGEDPICGDEFWHADDDYVVTFDPWYC